jgi:hypothetical protein
LIYEIVNAATDQKLATQDGPGPLRLAANKPVRCQTPPSALLENR